MGHFLSILQKKTKLNFPMGDLCINPFSFLKEDYPWALIIYLCCWSCTLFWFPALTHVIFQLAGCLAVLAGLGVLKQAFWNTRKRGLSWGLSRTPLDEQQQCFILFRFGSLTREFYIKLKEYACGRNFFPWVVWEGAFCQVLLWYLIPFVILSEKILVKDSSTTYATLNRSLSIFKSLWKFSCFGKMLVRVALEMLLPV